MAGGGRGVRPEPLRRGAGRARRRRGGGMCEGPLLPCGRLPRRAGGAGHRGGRSAAQRPGPLPDAGRRGGCRPVRLLGQLRPVRAQPAALLTSRRSRADGGPGHGGAARPSGPVPQRAHRQRLLGQCTGGVPGAGRGLGPALDSAGDLALSPPTLQRPAAAEPFCAHAGAAPGGGRMAWSAPSRWPSRYAGSPSRSRARPASTTTACPPASTCGSSTSSSSRCT